MRRFKVSTTSFGRRGVRYCISDGIATVETGMERNERRAKEVGRARARELETLAPAK